MKNCWPMSKRPMQQRMLGLCEVNMKRVKCDQCGKGKPLADVFIYEGKTYCMSCLYPLIMSLAESGNLSLDFEDSEDKGIRVSF